METKLLILIVTLLVGWLYLRRRKDQAAATTVDRRQKSGSTAYHSVSINYGPMVCTAARELEGKRYLASAAPRFPLPDCDVTKCECRFDHYRDRRENQDRRSVFQSARQSAATGELHVERRNPKERREEVDPFASRG